MSSDSSGFSLIEVIVAMFVLATVLGSAAAIVGANERLGRKVEAVGHQDAVAQQALESMRTDADQKDQCYAVWNGNPGTCTVPQYTVRWPEDGRLYEVRISIEAVDDPIDGTGVNDAVDATGGDADNNVLDHFDITVTADLQVDADERLSDFPAATLVGRLDWGEGQGDGSVKISVCGSVRPERGNNLSECNQAAADATLDNPTFYVNGVTVLLEPTGDYSNTGAGQSGTSGGFGEINFASVPEGKYRVVVDDTRAFSADNKDTRFFRASPEFVDIDNGEAQQEVSIAMTYEGGTTAICARLRNETVAPGAASATGVNGGGLGDPIGSVDPQWNFMMEAVPDTGAPGGNDPYVDPSGETSEPDPQQPNLPAAETNIAWGVTGSPVFRTMPLLGISFDPANPDAWQCDGPASVPGTGQPDASQARVNWQLFDPLMFGVTANEGKTFMGKNWLQIETSAAGAAVPGFSPFVTLRNGVDGSGCQTGAEVLGPDGLPALRAYNGNVDNLLPGSSTGNDPGLTDPMTLEYDRWDAADHVICLDATARASNVVQCVPELDAITGQPTGEYDHPDCEDTGLTETITVCVDPPPPGAGPCPGGGNITETTNQAPTQGVVNAPHPNIIQFFASGGPTSDVACIQTATDAQAQAHPWNPWGRWFTNSPAPFEWMGHVQSGGYLSYYSGGYEGWHAIGPYKTDRYWCNGEVSFALSSNLFHDNGSDRNSRRPDWDRNTGHFYYDDCFQVNFRGHPNQWIRGKIKDIKGPKTGPVRMNISVLGMHGLNPAGVRMQEEWNFYGTRTWENMNPPPPLDSLGMPYIDTKLVFDDPVCNYSSTTTTTTTVWADPELEPEETPVFAYVDDDENVPPILGEEEDSNVVVPTGDGTVEDDNGVTKGGRTL